MDCIRPSIAPFPASRRPVGRAQTPSAASPGAKERRNMGKGRGSRKRKNSIRPIAWLHGAMLATEAPNALSGRCDRRAPDRRLVKRRLRRIRTNSATGLVLMPRWSFSLCAVDVMHGAPAAGLVVHRARIGRGGSVSGPVSGMVFTAPASIARSAVGRFFTHSRFQARPSIPARPMRVAWPPAIVKSPDGHHRAPSAAMGANAVGFSDTIRARPKPRTGQATALP